MIDTDARIASEHVVDIGECFAEWRGSRAHVGACDLDESFVVGGDVDFFVGRLGIDEGGIGFFLHRPDALVVGAIQVLFVVETREIEAVFDLIRRIAVGLDGICIAVDVFRFAGVAEVFDIFIRT